MKNIIAIVGIALSQAACAHVATLNVDRDSRPVILSLQEEAAIDFEWLADGSLQVEAWGWESINPGELRIIENSVSARVLAGNKLVLSYDSIEDPRSTCSKYCSLLSPIRFVVTGLPRNEYKISIEVNHKIGKR